MNLEDSNDVKVKKEKLYRESRCGGWRLESVVTETIDNDVNMERVNDSSVSIGIDIEVDGEFVDGGLLCVRQLTMMWRWMERLL